MNPSDAAMQHFVDLHSRLITARGNLGIGRGEALAPYRDIDPIALVLDGRAYLYRIGEDGIRVEAGDHGGARVSLQLGPREWQDLFEQRLTIPGLLYQRRIALSAEAYHCWQQWDALLQFCWYGRPLFSPGLLEDPVALGYADGFEQSFDATQVGEAVRFLQRFGYARIRSAIPAAATAALQYRAREVATGCVPGDRFSWWARDRTGKERVSRLIYAGLRSPEIGAISTHPLYRQVVDSLDLDLVAMHDRMDGHIVVYKNVDSSDETLVNLPWHKDCGLGLHPWLCPSVLIGLQFTDADEQSGQLCFLPGSHRFASGVWEARCWSDRSVAVTASRGDLTLHFGDVLHAAPPALKPERGRETLYTQFYSRAILDMVPAGKGQNDIIKAEESDGLVKNLEEMTV